MCLWVQTYSIGRVSPTDAPKDNIIKLWSLKALGRRPPFHRIQKWLDNVRKSNDEETNLLFNKSRKWQSDKYVIDQEISGYGRLVHLRNGRSNKEILWLKSSQKGWDCKLSLVQDKCGNNRVQVVNF